MNTLTEILIYVTQTLGSLYLVVILLRFYLQLARADFYNQFSQVIVKLTNPVLIPLRRVTPGLFGIDIASIALSILFHLIVAELLYFLYTSTFVNPLRLIVWAILGNLMLSTYIIFVCGIVMVIASFIAPYSTHPIIQLMAQLIEPLARPIRKIIPPAGGLDFSIMFVFMGNYICQIIIRNSAASLQLMPQVIIGF